MKNMKSFTVRSSARVSDKYYIDCAGYSKINDIAEITGILKNKMEEIYRTYEAQFEDDIGVFYFPSRDHAINALKKLEDNLSASGTGKVVFLSIEEMEYIRQALKNEGSNIINVRNELKKGIFDKFNA